MALDETLSSGVEKAKVTLAQAEAKLREAKTAAERVEAQKLIQHASADLEKAAAAAKTVTLGEAEAMLRDAKNATERVEAQKLVHRAQEEAAKLEAAAAVELQTVQAKAAEVKIHIVKKGESLSLIAKEYYGDIHKWTQIYEANKAVVGDNPDLIKPGQELVIP